MHVPRVRSLVVGCAAAATTVLLGACSGTPEVELTQLAPGSAMSPTVTVTVPTTQTVVTTMTVIATVTVDATPSSGPALAPLTPAGSVAPFDRTRSLAAHGALVTDIAALDAMHISGPAAASALTMLDAHLAQLLAMQAPAGLDPPSYYARVTSLRLFAAAAAQEAAATSPQAAARYAIIRSETGVLLAMVNGATGGTLALPPAPSTTPPTLLTTR